MTRTGASGELLLRRNPRARRLILRIDTATGRPVVTIPPAATRHDISRFIEAHRGWIARRLAALPDRVRLTPGACFPFRGQSTRICHDPHAPRCPTIDGDRVRLGGPAELVESRLVRWLRDEARTDLAARAESFASRLGVTPGPLSVRDTKSRWGSCSAEGRLSFTWRLILAPPEIADYVVAHEIAHLQELNHSHRFWRIVESLVGDSKSARQWLNTHAPALFAIGPPRAPR